MLRISSQTKLTPEEAIKKAIAYFGPGGHKMEITRQMDNYASFEGAGGSIEVAANKEGGQTTLEFISVEWDYQVKEFIRSVR
jgi:hypothetical protein